MVVWLLAAAFAALALLVATGALRVCRYSRGYVVAELAIRGRGFYFSRTPDGTCWKLRLRRRRCDGWLGDLGDPPPAGGVREPRPPGGPGPRGAAARLELPM